MLTTRHLARAPIAATLIAALIAAYAVWLRAWISDDALITFRYVDNLLDGHGPVFNLGDHVQGYTHPLWFGVLALGSLFWSQPLYLVTTLGIAITVLTIVVAGYAISRQTTSPLLAAAAVLLLSILWASCETWRSFQTSGLENPLSNLLIVLLLVEAFRAQPRPLALSLLASLLFLTRPDLAILVAPLGLVSLYRWRGSRPDLIRLALGTTPAIVWLLFARLYYGDFQPNTANAKLGIYGTWEGFEVGFAYLKDWVRFEPLPALASMALLLLGIANCRRPLPLALAVGAVLQVVYVVAIGGDFMRGRMLLPLFVTGSMFGVLVLVETLKAPGARSTLSGVVVAFVIAGAYLLAHPPIERQPPDGIVWEREFYPAFHLDRVRKNHGRLENTWVMDNGAFWDIKMATLLKEYATRCDGVTIHALTLGYAGWSAGSGVDVIDVFGLTDRTIARLPNNLLVQDRPRPGHPYKFLPVSYLAQRGDIGILDNWWLAVDAMDCSLKQRLEPYEQSNAEFNPYQPVRLP